MANGATSVDHKRKYYDASGVMVPNHGPYRPLGDWPCSEPGCFATGNRPGRAFCHKFGCNGRPEEGFRKEQARLQRKWEAEQKIRPGAAPYVPGAGRAKPKGNAAGKTGGGADAKLAAENKRLVAENKRLAAASTAAPPNASAPTTTAPAAKANAKALKVLEEKLGNAKQWAADSPDKGYYKDMVADLEAELALARPQKVVQTSDLQLEMEGLLAGIEGDKARWQKKKKEEEKLLRQQAEIADAVLEKQSKVAELEVELAKRMSAITAAPAPAPAQLPQMPPATVTSLPLVLDGIKRNLGQCGQASSHITESTRTLGKELEAMLGFAETYTALACRFEAAFSGEKDYLLGIEATAAPPLNASGHEPVQVHSPERAAGEVQAPPAPEQQQRQHPALEPAIPPPLPSMHGPQPRQLVDDGTGVGLPPQSQEEPMHVDGVGGDPKRKAPFDQEAWDKQLAMARASKGQGKGESSPEKKGKTIEE